MLTLRNAWLMRIGLSQSIRNQNVPSDEARLVLLIQSKKISCGTIHMRFNEAISALTELGIGPTKLMQRPYKG